MHTAEMSLVFATNFSARCYQAISAVAQWLLDVPSRLTLLHVHDPLRTRSSDAERRLRGFFPEADRFPNTRRVLLTGSDPARAIADYLARHTHDMLVCPVGERIGSHRPLHRSTRAQLLAHTETTLWTIGTAMDYRRAPRAERVGCIVSRRSDNHRPIALASAYALRIGAIVQLIYLMPEEHEARALPQRDAMGLEALQTLLPALPRSSEVHAVVGSEARHVLYMLEHAKTDILFAGKQETMRRAHGGFEMAHFVDSAKCPIICVDHDRNLPSWRLHSEESLREYVAV